MRLPASLRRAVRLYMSVCINGLNLFAPLISIIRSKISPVFEFFLLLCYFEFGLHCINSPESEFIVISQISSICIRRLLCPSLLLRDNFVIVYNLVQRMTFLFAFLRRKEKFCYYKFVTKERKFLYNHAVY